MIKIDLFFIKAKIQKYETHELKGSLGEIEEAKTKSNSTVDPWPCLLPYVGSV